MENSNTQYWIDEGFKSQDKKEYEMAEKCYKRVIECCEKAILLNSNDTIAFFDWGNALFKLAEIKKEEALFRSACEKYKKTTQLDPNVATVFYNWGLALHNLAEIKQDKTLFRSACEKYKKATQLDSNDASTFNNWGLALYKLAGIKHDEALFGSACEKYEKATQLDPNNASALYNWGLVLYKLAKTKQDEAFQKKLEIFERASKVIDDPDTFLIKGELYFLLYQKENCQEYERKVIENFEKSKNDILSILTFLDKYNEEKIIKTEILHSLLDLETTSDGKFFKETIGDQSEEQKKEYKDIYIHSISIISRLHVNNPNEKFVAHYREKEISQQLLIGKTEFRLNAINYSNDPSEGKTLLDFLFGEEKRPSDERISNEEYEAFAGCFVFDYNNLNMFRLYGKNEEKKEGTGLSLVFQDSFFSKEAKMVLGSPKTGSFENNNDNSVEKDKLALYRCIYIDPDSETVHHIVTVGRKEEYLFYREKKESELNGYNKEIDDIIAHIREEMDYIKDKSENLNPAIVGQLLLNLRYLVKHVAFKEEQECRIVKIHHINDGEVQIDDNYKKMYIKYLPNTNISTHINKICFGPKATDFELFKRILKNKNLNIPCEQSKNPFA
ncbi:MAG: tetratricopeptide repeat protein [Treponema sp.]|jgi:tetratricopeptide (TPR) repeat protein|nr:tetratricopeptide repeat protein [Treponema sp.]